MVQNSVSVSLTFFAGLDALGPCMIKLCVASISTFLEPSTATNATAVLTRFLGSATVGAYATDHF